MRLKKSHRILLGILLFLGIFAQGLTMVRSGLIYDFGMGFWGPNGHDGVWHLALTNQVFKSLPPPHPTFSGFKLTNYHYFYDLLLALINRLTAVPIVTLYFQVFPVLLAASLGILSFLVGYYWQKDFWTGFWLAFFNYFGGSFGYLVTLWRDGQLGGESLFWSMQSASTLINPPFALSLVILLAGMLILLKTSRWNLKRIIVTGFLFGVLINIKAYAGLIGLVSLSTFSLFQYLKRRKVYLKIFVLALFISLLIFIPINRGAGSLFVWKPFWFVHSMVESSDRFYWPRLATARYVFLEKKSFFRLALAELVGLAIFLIGNLGTRLIGGWGLLGRFKSRKLLAFDWFLLVGAGAGFLIPLLWVQRGTAWNTIQFFYYCLFFINFYAAMTMAKIIAERKFKRFFLILVLILLTLPTTLASLRGYLGWPPPASIPREELEALAFLEEKEPGIVLTFPYDAGEKKGYFQTPLTLRVYESTAYVAALSGQQVFLEDEVNLNISDYQWRERREEALRFFYGEGGKFEPRGFLVNNRIAYLYLVGNQKVAPSEEVLQLIEIFNNGQVKIYQVSGII
jgi:hypothetical protein